MTYKEALTVLLGLQAQDLAQLLPEEVESTEKITPLSAQKLLYFAQGFFLARHGRALFQAEFQAWDLGPVIPELWVDYKGMSAPIPFQGEVLRDIPEEVGQLLEEISLVYGGLKSSRLVALAHNTGPWKNHHVPKGKNPIPVDEIRAWFSEPGRLQDFEDEAETEFVLRVAPETLEAVAEVRAGQFVPDEELKNLGLPV